MSVATISYKEADKPVFSDTLEYADGTLVDLGSGGAKVNEVRFYMERYMDGGLIINDASGVTITDGPNGEVEYAFDGDEFEADTYYRAEWRIDFVDGRIRRLPPNGYIAIEADDALGTLNAATIADSDLTVANLTATDSFSLGPDGPATSFADISGGTDVETQVTGSTESTATSLYNFLAAFDVSEPVADQFDIGIDESNLSGIPDSALASPYTDEKAQDAVGTILSSSFDYSDATPSISLTNDSVTITAGDALTGGGTVTLGGTTTINVDEASITPSELGGAVFDVDARDIAADGTTIWNESNNSLTANINTPFANIDTLFIPDKGSNPGANGQIRQNNNDILAYSGGAVRNLSNIGAGGGAPTDASYLTTATESGLSNETVVGGYPFTATDLAAGSVGTAELQADAVTSSEILDGAVDTAALATGAVTTAKVATDAVDTAAIQTGAVTTTEVADGTLTSTDWDDESFEDAVGTMAGPGLTYDDPNGQLEAGIGFTQVTASSDYTASPSESVWADASSNSVTVTLPSPDKSDEVRVTAIDATNAITLSESGSEGIQTPDGTVSSYQLVEDETIHVESDGLTWQVVGSLSERLDSGTLGTLSTGAGSEDFAVNGVTTDETKGIAAVSVFPGSDPGLSADYAFSSEFSREWDESAGAVDLTVTVTWDTDPGSDITLDYIVWEGAGGGGGTGGGGADEAFTTSGPITASTYTATWDEVVIADTSGGSITVTLPSPTDIGQVTVKKAASANTLTIARPGSESIDGSAADLSVTAANVSRTLVSDGTDYWVI